MRRRFLSLALASWVASGPALACAVPTRIELRNETRRVLRQVFLTEQLPTVQGDSRFNVLEQGELPPGAAATITFPSCMGTYRLTAVFADGTVERRDGLDAGRIRGLALR